MIRNRFEALKSIQKVQLYLLLPMLLWLLLFSIEDSFLKPNINSSKRTKVSSSINIWKIDKTTTNQIVNFLEKKLEFYKLSLESIDIKQKLISLQVTGSFEQLLSFLQKLQIHLDVVSFKLLQEKERVSFFIQVHNEYFFNKTLLKKEFYMKGENIQYPLEIIKIDAIVDDEVLLKEIWYKKGDSYKHYKLIKVAKKFIQLQNTQTQQVIKVELADESL